MTIDRNQANLHPMMRDNIRALIADLGPKWKFFEGFRHPDRQALLFEKGVSKARPWQSAHQYGLAADFVPILNGAIAWPPIENTVWIDLHTAAQRHGLQAPISWDPGHIQHPAWSTIRNAI